MNKVVFLDRDGVINRDNIDYTFRIADFHFNDGIYDALEKIQSKGFLLIIITNQSGIAKSIYSHEDVRAVHDHLEKSFAEKNIRFAAIYYCPHHPTKGNCLCRKPGSLLLEKAIARFTIDPAQSYFIGDRQRDVEAGERAGVTPVLVEENADLHTILHLIK